MTTDKAVISLTDDELLAEAADLSLRVAHSNLPARDAMLVIELATRLHSRAQAQPIPRS